MDNTADVSMELNIEKKEKLNQLLEELHDKAAIDYNNTEIKDIESAVHEMMWKITEGINKRGNFKISRLQACGSMAEKVSVWKHLKYREHCDGLGKDDAFIEFDFLPMIGDFNDENTGSRCPECAEVNMPEFFKTIRTRENPLYDHMYGFQKLFLEEGIATAEYLFECMLIDRTYADNSNINVSFRHDFSVCNRGCYVIRATGELQLSTSASIKLSQSRQTPSCSFILQWKSNSGSLYAPNGFFAQSRQIKELHIFIDFLPAFESQESKMAGDGYEYKTFLIPKECNYCEVSFHDCWKKSMCLSEAYNIKNKMSDSHRKCYRLMKCLLELMDDTVLSYSYLNHYQVKTVVLQHSRKCLVTTEEYADCILNIFRELIHAYETPSLRSFHSDKRFKYLKQQLSVDFRSYMEKLHSVTKNDTLDLFVRKIKAGSISLNW